MAGLVPPTTTGEAPEGDKYQVESDKYKNSREIIGKDGNRLSHCVAGAVSTHHHQ